MYLDDGKEHAVRAWWKGPRETKIDKLQASFY